MNRVDIPNLLAMFEESLRKIIEHLEHGRVDSALVRAKDTYSVFNKMLEHIGYSEEEVINRL